MTMRTGAYKVERYVHETNLGKRRYDKMIVRGCVDNIVKSCQHTGTKLVKDK